MKDDHVIEDLIELAILRHASRNNLPTYSDLNHQEQIDLAIRLWLNYPEENRHEIITNNKDINSIINSIIGNLRYGGIRQIDATKICAYFEDEINKLLVEAYYKQYPVKNE